MKKTVFDKVVVGFVILVIAIFTILAFVMIHTSQNQLEKNIISSKQKDFSLVIDNIINPQISSNSSLEDLEKSINKAADNLDTYIWLADESGNIVIFSNNLDKKNIPTDLSAYTKNTGVSDFTEEKELNLLDGNNYLIMGKPIYEDGSFIGTVIMISSMSSKHDIVTTLIGSVYTPFLVLVLLSLIALMLMTNSMLKPIREIIGASKSYALGNFNARVNVTANNEFGELARSMEQMADELSRSNEYRKSFISNISHDFRSPLTSIKGYIEAMLDGTIPPELHEKYLNTVLNETLRLTKLTQGLLELNNFDSFDLQLDKSNFDLKEIITPTINTFEGRCQDKGIYLHSIFHTDNTFVYADRTKIQQVIYNLVDNAIKFTPEGRQITIQVTEKNDKIFTSVKDEGVGIAPEAQKKVFERFYKTDQSRGKDKVGNGLGLAIIKEIIKAHGENITLTSTLGEGSEFLFSLPMQKAMQVPIKPVHTPTLEKEKNYFSNGKFKIKKN